MRALFVFASVTIFFFLFVSTGQASVIEFDRCQDIESKCTIHEVRIEPCATVGKNKMCKIKLGTTASISFDFTPEFTSDTLYVNPFWGSIGFADMDVNGCKYTQCPVTSGEKQTYTYNMRIAKKNPKGIYPVEWMIGKSKSNVGSKTDPITCCFRHTIKLH